MNMNKKLLFALASSALLLAGCNTPVQPEESSVQPSSENSITSEVSESSEISAISVSEYSPEATSIDETLVNDEAYDYDAIKVHTPEVALVEDFAFGADLSSVAEVEANGGVYYNEEGKPEDVFQILARNGVNYCRLRLWNDPYSDIIDANGEHQRLSYGGGGNDIATDIYLAKRAKAAGMKVLIDFHYSDHWADPAKYHAPKAWQDCLAMEMPELLGEFTAGALQAFKDAGVTVDSVQIGNEENTGLAGWKFAAAGDTIAEMVAAGVAATKSVFPEAKTLVHLTNIKSTKSVTGFLDKMAEFEVPYDIVGLSYYPFWHGSQDLLLSMMNRVKNTYGKPTWIVETSYGFTDEAAEWASNQYNKTKEVEGGYLTSWQGQTSAIADIISTISKADEQSGQGVFYWEPAWLPVRGSTWATGAGQYYNEHGVDAPNMDAISESVYPETSCKSSWANQGWFSYTGKVLPSAATYKYVASGEKDTTENIIGIRQSEMEVNVNLRKGVILPSTTQVVSDFDALRARPIVWNADEVAAITVDGQYEVHGTVDDTYDVIAHVTAETNWIADYSFEEQRDGEQVSVREPWVVDCSPASAARIEAKSEGNLDGSKYFHWYAAQDFSYELTQVLTDVNPGTYDLSTRIMAGALAKDYKKFDLWYRIGDGEKVVVDLIAAGIVTGYNSDLNKGMKRGAIENIVLESKTTLTIGLTCEASGGAWGHNDLWSFATHKDHGEEETGPKNYILDGGFQTALGTAWTVDANPQNAMAIGEEEIAGSESGSNLKWWASSAFSFGLHQDVASLEAGEYTFTMLLISDVASNYNSFVAYYELDGVRTEVDLLPYCHGWGTGAPYQVQFTISVPSACAFSLGFVCDAKAGCWGRFTDCLLTK